MPNKINILKFLIVVLFLSTIAIATETTWRHSGFEISGFDINGSSTYNLTEIRKIEFGWNTSIPIVSETSRAVIYYDDNQKRIMQSVNGGAYQAIVTNATVDFRTGNASNLTSGVVPNANMPLNVSYNSSKIGIFYGRNATGIVNLVQNTYYKMYFPAFQINPSAEFSNVTGNYTVPTNGYYNVRASITYNEVVVGELYFVSVFVNGVSYDYEPSIYNSAITGHDYTAAVYDSIIYLNAGDTVSLYAKSNGAAGTVNVNVATLKILLLRY